MPALDGLRALAVIAVIIYHGGEGILPGGFIGVDLFFVLSGFLITSLLLSEHRSSGSINLGQFWARRFRRLLPALFVFLVTVAIWAAIAADPSTLGDLRRASLAGLAYVANWWFIISGTSYGASFSAPSPVLHLWSLSVEEQYYIIWPLLITALFAVAARKQTSKRRVLAWFAVLAATVSTVWMFLLATRGVSADRMYFGTDTRAATILAGVLLAALLEPVLEARLLQVVRVTRARNWTWGALGVTGAVIMLTVALTVHEHDSWLYRGGFTLVAGASAAMIAAAVLHPAADRLLGVAPLRWVGTRSYGLYLWHWGVLVALTVALPRLTGWTRLALVVALTTAIAELSYRLVERPIRTRRYHLPVPRLLVPTAFITVAALLLIGTTGANDTPEYLRPRSLDDVTVVTPPSSTTSPTSTAAPTSAVPTSAVPTSGPPQVVSTTQPPPILHPTRVTMVGDSVGASLAPAMTREFAKAGVAFADASVPGCGVLEGDIADDRGRPLEFTASCSGTIPRFQREVIERTNPDLVVVLSSWEAGDRIVDGIWNPFGTPGADAELFRLYDEMLDRLTVRGARVALVTIPDPVDSARGPAKTDQTRRLRHQNEIMAKVVAQDPLRASLVRLDNIVCPSDPCPKVVDGIELRAKDGTHYADPAAAKLVASRLVPRILDVPAGSLR